MEASIFVVVRTSTSNRRRNTSSLRTGCASLSLSPSKKRADWSLLLLCSLLVGLPSSLLASRVQSNTLVKDPARVLSGEGTDDHEFLAVGDQLPGPIRTGGMTFDARSNQVWIAGTTYGGDFDESSKCIVTSVDLQTGRIKLPVSEYGQEAGSRESCSAVAYSQQNDLVYAIGSTPQGGYLVGSHLYAEPKRRAKTFGLLLQLNATDTANPLGAAFAHHEFVNEPIQIILDPSENYAYVIHMSGMVRDPYYIPAEDRPRFIITGSFDYGRHFKVRVVKYRVRVEKTSGDIYRAYRHQWTAQFWVEEMGYGSYPTGISLAGNAVVVVGSTRGTAPEGIINAEYVESPYGTENPGGDMDGYLFKLDTETGNFHRSSDGRWATRLDSVNQKDDWVLGVCTDAFDPNAVYVVGASNGKVRDLPANEQPIEGTTYPFITKINLETMLTEWFHHFPMQQNENGDLASGAAYGCAITSDNIVYIGGMIESGATLDGASKTPNSDKDDIFVAQLQGGDGQLNWIHQIGTSQDERLAHNRGIAVDSHGNAVVYASTTGNFYRQRPSNTPAEMVDAVVFTMNKIDGAYKELIEDGGSEIPTLEQEEEDKDAETSGDREVLPNTISAYQSGPDFGPSYAGGMYYDRPTNTIHITGETYGSFSGPGVRAEEHSNCFYGALILPQFRYRERTTYGTSFTPEACNAISMTTISNSNTAIIVGATETNGLLSKIGSAREAKQYGFALDVANINGIMELQGGAFIDDSAVQYPTMVETLDDQVWIASMVSSDTMVTPDFSKISNEEFPNLTNGGIAKKFGNKYSIVLEKYKIQRTNSGSYNGFLQNSLQREWRKPFEPANQESIFLSSMITVAGGEQLVVVGSTINEQRSSQMNGLMAKLDPATGNFVSGNSRNSPSVAYLESPGRQDDWILGACPDPDQPDYFYVVGSTQGELDPDANRNRRDVTVHAMVAKIALDDLTPVWTKQFSVTHDSGTHEEAAAAVALGCDVIGGSGEMYIAGNVEKGAVLDDSGVTRSAGRDDIFVGKLKTTNGQLQWMKQVGSNGDDRVARSGGVKVDANGNAVVYGDTNGSFFRERHSDGGSKYFSDLFVIILNRVDGAHTIPFTGDPFPSDRSAPTEWFPTGVKRVKPSLLIILLAVFLPFLFLCCCCSFCCFAHRRAARRQEEERKESVFLYLQHFDPDDIDLRRSPVGGWNISYLNRLAEGLNKSHGNTGELDDTGSVISEAESFLSSTSDDEEFGHPSVAMSDAHSQLSLFADSTSRPCLRITNGTSSLHGSRPVESDLESAPSEDLFQDEDVVSRIGSLSNHRKVV